MASGTEEIAACTVAFGRYAMMQKKPFLERERCSDKANRHADGTKRQRDQYHSNGSDPGAQRIANIHCSTHKHKQNHLGGNPQLSEFIRQTLCHAADAFDLQNARHTDYGKQSRHGDPLFHPCFDRNQKKRHPENNNYLYAVANEPPARISLLKSSASKKPNTAPTATPSRIETGIFIKSSS